MSEVARVIFEREAIQRRVEELGHAITGDYEGRVPVLVSVLKGGTMFLADLLREIPGAVEVRFMAISRYAEGSDPHAGRVRILMDVEDDLAGRDVIVVEDIVDTGLTLSYLLANLRRRGLASLEVCTLLDRSKRRIVPIEIKYIGFDCPDDFVIGYGLDHDERYRNLSSILAVSSMGVLDADPAALDHYVMGGLPQQGAEATVES
jgi:hypoxanthine phosphoribosyltransferase